MKQREGRREQEGHGDVDDHDDDCCEDVGANDGDDGPD